MKSLHVDCDQRGQSSNVDNPVKPVKCKPLAASLKTSIPMTYHMNSLWTVSSGATITCSPDFSVFRMGWELEYCSAHMGVTFALIPPVPKPMVIMAAINPPNPTPCVIAVGVEVVTRMRRPTM